MNDEWETPNSVFDPLHAEFAFTIDAAASDENHKLERYWTVAENGLDKPWYAERVWLNPPYSRGQLDLWLAKIDEEVNGPEPAELVVALLPADTSTRYFHRYVIKADEVRFLEGRVRFVGAPGAPKFGSIVAVWCAASRLPRRTHITTWRPRGEAA